MFKLKGKKAVVPIIVWIIIGVIGIFVAKEAGLFGIIYPTPEYPGTVSLVNPVYYGPVASSYNFACDGLDRVVFRTNVLNKKYDNTGTKIDGKTAWIALNDSDLKGFIFSSTYESLGSPSNLFYTLGNNVKIYKPSNLVVDAGITNDHLETKQQTVSCSYPTSLCSCGQNIPNCGWDLLEQQCNDLDYDGSGTYGVHHQSGGEVCFCSFPCTYEAYVPYKVLSNYVPSSLDYINKTPYPVNLYSSNGLEEYNGEYFIQNYKYACRNDDIVFQNCNAFLSNYSTVFDCASNQPCNNYQSYQVGTNFYSAVKCGDELDLYTPNKKLCVDTNSDEILDTLYTTDSEGHTIDYETCGFVCDSQTLICKDCDSSFTNKRCAQNIDTTTDREVCVNNKWIQDNSAGSTCIGDQLCINANCVSDFVPGMKRCAGLGSLQPYVYTSGFTWITNGSECDVACLNPDDYTAECQNECELGYNCNFGSLSRCDATDRDNDKVELGICITGNCSDSSHCLSAYNLGDKYCINNQVMIAVSSSNLLLGEIGEEPLGSECINGCSNGECIPATGCQGNANNFICIGVNKIKCSSDTQTYISTEDCSLTYNGGYCEAGACVKPEPECTGTLYCTNTSGTDGVILPCYNEVLGSEIVSNCNNLGCNKDSQDRVSCNDECNNIESEKICRDGDSYKCSIFDVDNRIYKDQKIFTLNSPCGSRGCENGVCTSQCNGTKICQDGVLKSCDEGVIGTEFDNCYGKGCNTQTNTCINTCVVPQQLQCYDSDLWRCTEQINLQKILVLNQSCFFECDILADPAVCTVECTGQKFCSSENDGNSVIRECESGGIPGIILDECYGIGCNVNTTSCLNECFLDTYDCREGDSYKCQNKSNGQRIFEYFQDCGSGTCSNGRCSSECSGTKTCIGGTIYSCDYGDLGDEIDSCNNAGCDTFTNECNNECSDLGIYTCSESDSIYCFKNITNEQYMTETIDCGSEGCGSDGKCKSKKPNTYYCISESLFLTDSLGYLPQNPNKVCLDPTYCPVKYVSTGESSDVDCHYCEANQPFCTSTEFYYCDNPLTGEKRDVQSCEAGCSIVDNNYKCDQLDISISPNQNFLADSILTIKGSLRGSSSENGIKTPITASISGVGVSKTVSIISLDSGNFSLDFGQLLVGVYNITITLDNFDKTFNVMSKVTEGYALKSQDVQVVQRIPGTTPEVIAELQDNKGGVPDTISVLQLDIPQGLSVTSQSTGVSGKWKLFVNGEPGKYLIKITPIKNQVELEKVELWVELRKPQLTTTSNVPKSRKLGKETYNLKITGPTAGDTSGPISLDSITATMSHSPAVTLTLLPAGAGSYTFEYDFLDLGTYVLNVNAVKDGYESSIYSETIYVSDSGTDIAPGSATSSAATGTNATSTTTTTPSITTTGTGSSKTLWIVIIIGAIIFFISRRKK